MTTATELLRAPHIGIKKFKTGFSKRVKSHQALVLTDHGLPKKVLIDYEEMVDMIETLQDLDDSGLWKSVDESRRAIARGEKGIPVVRPLKK